MRHDIWRTYKIDGEKIAKNIRLARANARMTVQELSEKSDVALWSIYHYEYGDRIPRVDTALRLAAALGTTLDVLIGTDVVDIEWE